MNAASVTKAKKLMKRRQEHLDRVELLSKLHAVGEGQRARHMVRQLQSDIGRMEGELLGARMHNNITAQQRAAHGRNIAILRRQLATAIAKLK